MGLLSRLFGSKKNELINEAIKDGAYIVDVRTPAEYSAGSVRGAVNIPLSNIQKQLKKFNNKNNIVVFCRSGARSGQAKRILESNGIQNVYNGGTVGRVNELIRNNK